MDDTISSLGTISSLSPLRKHSRLGSEFKILSRLGEGSFSTVYKVERQTDRQIYALKKVRLSRLSEKEKASALNEIRVLASIRNQHVIAYKESFFDEPSESLCIVMEYAANGDLLAKLQTLKAQNFFQQAEKEVIEEEEVVQEATYESASVAVENTVSTYNPDGFRLQEHLIWSYLGQITLGLRSLHELGILHRDLKCANILLDSLDTIKIGDLNVSIVQRCNTTSSTINTTQTGTPYYTAPEIWSGSQYTSHSDIWSLGCIIYELCSHHPPFRSTSLQGLLNSIIKGEFQRIPQIYSDDLAAMVAICLSTQPFHRPSCDSILAVIADATTKLALDNPKTPLRDVLKGDVLSLQQRRHLIDTIAVPSTMKRLQGILPGQNYDSDKYYRKNILRSDNSPPSSAKETTQFDKNSNISKQHSSEYQQSTMTNAVSTFEDEESLNQAADNLHQQMDKQQNPLPSQEGEVRALQNQQKRFLHGQLQDIQLYHDIFVRDSPFRLNLKKVPMDKGGSVIHNQPILKLPSHKRKEGQPIIEEVEDLPANSQEYSTAQKEEITSLRRYIAPASLTTAASAPRVCLAEVRPLPSQQQQQRPRFPSESSHSSITKIAPLSPYIQKMTLPNIIRSDRCNGSPSQFQNGGSSLPSLLYQYSNISRQNLQADGKYFKPPVISTDSFFNAFSPVYSPHFPTAVSATHSKQSSHLSFASSPAISAYNSLNKENNILSADPKTTIKPYLGRTAVECFSNNRSCSSSPSNSNFQLLLRRFAAADVGGSSCGLNYKNSTSQSTSLLTTSAQLHAQFTSGKYDSNQIHQQSSAQSISSSSHSRISTSIAASRLTRSLSSYNSYENISSFTRSNWVSATKAKVMALHSQDIHLPGKRIAPYLIR